MPKKILVKPLFRTKDFFFFNEHQQYIILIFLLRETLIKKCNGILLRNKNSELYNK